MNENLLGKCGYYCGYCPTFIQGKCAGCVDGNQAGVCYSRDCVLKKGIHACGECVDFPCEEIIERPKATLLSTPWLEWKKSQKNSWKIKLM